MIIFFNLQGDIIYAGEFILSQDTIAALDNKICQAISKVLFNEGLRHHLIKGILTIYKDEPFIISAESILTSQHKGPLRGWIVMGRRLDLKPIMGLTGLAINITYDDNTQICKLDDEEGHILNIKSKADYIYASHNFYDVLNQKMLSVNVREINRIARQGNKTSLYILSLLTIFGILTFYLSIIGLNYIVIKPLLRSRGN